MGVRSRLRNGLTRVAKVFGPGVPPAIAAAEAASQMTPASPFSPGEPVGPYDGYSREPRSREVVTGYNIAARPRTHERVSFDTLKGLIGSYDVARICIRHRIASLRSLDYKLIAAEDYDGDVASEIAEGKRVLSRPDSKTLFRPWLAKYLRGILSYDAGTLYRMRNRAGRPVGLKVIDGTQIAPLLDYWGDSPDSPAPAYVQYANGLPWNWLTRDDLIYEPYDPQDDSIYGLAPIEDILLNANTDIRFQVYFLQRFTDGNIPAAFAAAPESWSPGQIEAFQEYWDGFMYGDQSRKSQIRWMPGGSKFTWSNEKDFSDHFSLFLMRKTCSSYSVVPADLGFTESVNRSSGESQADVQHRVGDLPLALHVQDILSAFLRDDLQLPLRFQFDLGEEQDDRAAQAQADEAYMKMGVISPTDIREMRYGLAEPGGRPVPRFIYTERAGPIPLASLYAVAGEVDPATAAPAPGAPLPRQVFGGTEGVLPNPPIKVMSLAEREFGESAMPPAPPPQPKMTAADETAPGEPVAKDGETAGITSETGITGYDLIGGGEHGAEVARELAAFRRFRSARRKAGEWRDFRFEAVGAESARRLNAEGRDSVRKAASGYEISPRSGMISLDLPPGTLSPVPGGTDDHHVTVVYLGPDVDDEAFAAACDRAALAAALVPSPLPGTVSGVGAFPPSGSSDGKVPAWAAIAVPGAERLREALADLSASEHPGWTPHVTLAYLDPGDPLPAPLDPVPVTFTHLSVHRGEDVQRFPLGGEAGGTAGSPANDDGPDMAVATAAAEKRRAGLAEIERLMRMPPSAGRGSRVRHRTGSDDHLEMGVAKAGDGHPKAPAPPGSAPDWPGWKLDLPAAAYWAPRVRDAVTTAAPSAKARVIARDYLADHPHQDGKATGKRERNKAASAWLAAWLARRGIVLVPQATAHAIATDGYLIGAASARAAVAGSATADTGGWQPGDTGSAQETAKDLGLAAALAALLSGGSGGAAPEAIASGYAGSLAVILAGADAEWADSQETLDELGGMLSDALASEDLAVTLVGTEINIYTGLAAHDYYMANSVAWGIWATAEDQKVCPVCLANAAQGPVLMGQPYQSGHIMPPAHPGGCIGRCAVVPSPPPGS
jgi:hypothetical protein